jgi:hypothetical protein
MAVLLFKAIGIWVLLVVVAVLNGVIREKLLAPRIGACRALPLSGVLLSVVIFLITLILIPIFQPSLPWHYWLVGGTWVSMTVAFEYLFGHYVMEHSWRELTETYNVRTGNLWSLVLLTTAISPYLAAWLRGLG